MGASAADPTPRRIGDAERDQAVGYLRDHLVAGRLDQVEFDERLTQVLAAKTAAQLQPPFDDLPAPRPGEELAVLDPSARSLPGSSASGLTPAATAALPAQRAGRVLGIISAATWPAVIMVLFATSSWGSLWWLIFIPVILSSIAGSLAGEGKKDQRELEKKGQDEEQPRDD
jgi:hypothetical protein